MQFSSDVEAVDRNASTYWNAIVGHSANAAEFNQFNVAKTIKYNLERLKELRLITEEEQSQLNQLADQAGTILTSRRWFRPSKEKRMLAH